MPLYVVLRHPKHPKQVWSNAWRPDDRLVDAITTNREVAALCEAAARAGDVVYVHRCACGGAGAEITCRARVRAVSTLGRDHLVQFDEPEPLSATPIVQPVQGQDYYVNAAPEGC